MVIAVSLRDVRDGLLRVRQARWSTRSFRWLSWAVASTWVGLAAGGVMAL